MTAVVDQADAATDDLQRRLVTMFGEPRNTMPSKHPLHAVVDRALDEAILNRRCCPHVKPSAPMPMHLDVWRRYLHCGFCMPTEPLPGDEEHRCDSCRELFPEGQEKATLVMRIAFIETGLVVCLSCYENVKKETAHE